MKRVIFAVVLSVFAAAVCIFGYCNTLRSTKTLILSAERIDVLIAENQTDEALRESEKLKNDWEEIHGTLCVFLPHEHLEPLESILAVLPHYIEQEEYPLARSECRLIKSTAEHIQKTERISLENIF